MSVCIRPSNTSSNRLMLHLWPQRALELTMQDQLPFRTFLLPVSQTSPVQESAENDGDGQDFSDENQLIEVLLQSPVWGSESVVSLKPIVKHCLHSRAKETVSNYIREISCFFIIRRLSDCHTSCLQTSTI